MEFDESEHAHNGGRAGHQHGIWHYDTTIIASVNGLTARASLTVSLPALLSIVVTPPTPTIYQRTATQLKATGEYADGTEGINIAP